MTERLLVVSVGPVQEFIEHARRTRDLWFGSHVLSELSRAVARSLHREGWRLVAPSFDPKKLESELSFQAGPLGTGVGPEEFVSSVVNKVYAVRDTDDETITISVKAARVEVLNAWKKFANGAISKAGSLVRRDIEEAHHPENVGKDLVELYAAWAEITQGFAKARQVAEKRLASRKAVRDFSPWQGAGRPKSSLDGFRETILIERSLLNGKDAPSWTSEAKRKARQIGLGKGEHLDGVGFVKRAGGDPQQFIPVSTIAFSAWTIAARERSKRPNETRVAEAWKKLEDACENVGLRKSHDRSAQWMSRAFSFDAEVLLEGQWPNLEIGDERDAEASKKFGKDFAGPFLKTVGSAPYPYVACLVADGDRMGETLDALGSVESFSAVAGQLTDFARGVRAIVEKHFGALVYAGGDDVLAILPVSTAVEASRELRDNFHLTMKNALGRDHNLPTLSVGLGIGHVQSTLAHLLSLGRRAEKIAKGDSLPPKERRNALAILVDKRSGGEDVFRSQWESSPDQAIRHLSQCFAERRIPGKLPYELRDDVLARFPSKLPEGEPVHWRNWLEGDVLAVVRKKRPDGDACTVTLSEIGLRLEDASDYAQVRKRIDEWVSIALIARTLAEATRSVEKARSSERDGSTP